MSRARAAAPAQAEAQRPDSVRQDAAEAMAAEGTNPLDRALREQRRGRPPVPTAQEPHPSQTDQTFVRRT
ncbi:hypothetical protein EAT49_05440 [Histidinibacterium lentulum]|uniref:Uncharacterized protein n=1 Tax=Histidinibacterium lentulum TaxID=2480588 RepID=A0A3N2R8E0_9RHOB|nr:hypothetical protein EAT49_05440 [Histidinibacterium lentulum]